MRTLAGLIGLSLCLGLAPQTASAAGFDGHWVADIPAQGRCTSTATMNLVVAGDTISGVVQNPSTQPSLTGKLEADGTATFVVDRRYSGTMMFRGDHFEATWNNGSCDRHAEGDRAPDAAQQEAAAAERRRRQDAYANLIRRAEAGAAVDYGQLRAESVYAKDWEFYDNKASGLLDQANALVKGKDCVQALAILDRVIKLDFTMDSAHALRADCLRQTGEADKARVEDAIAKGLIHSLMDGFGGPHGLTQTLTAAGGSTEDSAYVVSTYREEMDVLANRHIQLKTRQTEIRGSNGRYYDLVHGIAIASGPGSLDVRARDIYFDITSFVTGRASRRAAQQVLAAQLQ